MFGLFEDKESKRKRLEQLDYENTLGSLQAEKEGSVYFGFRYEDDGRTSSERKESIEQQKARIWWL